MKLLKIVIVPALVLMLGLCTLPQAVFAHNGEVHDDTTNASSLREKALEKIRELQAKREAASQERQAKLEDIQATLKERFKQACEKSKTNYQNKFSGLAERSSNHLGVLDKVLERVKAFKESKKLTVAKYDELVAVADAKKQIVHDLQDTARQKAAEDFSCDRATALESVEIFKDILRQQIEAIKEYKTAVKNLIAVIKTAAIAARSQNDEN